MPTIDQLPPASSVSDTDELVVSQTDIARKATRGQLLAGVQPALAVAQGNLLGRMSSGTGSPEAIAIGANLTLANGALSAPAGFVVANQTPGQTLHPGDLVAVAQGGQNAAVSYAAFAAGLAGVAGINASSFVANANGGAGPRALASLFADAITVESFGAIGDGVTDDTAAFSAAAASGRPLRLDSRVYAIAGSLTFSTATALLGVAGGSVLLRTSAGSGAGWIDVPASAFAASGITFDAGGLAATNGPALTIDETCQSVLLQNCVFTRALGSTAGHGVAVNAASTATIELMDCTFLGNSCDGLSAVSCDSLIVRQCRALDNGAAGIAIQSGIDCIVENNNCSGNQQGVAIGDWQIAAPVGQALTVCRISDNVAASNSGWAIAVNATGAAVCGNIVTGNGSVGQGGGMVCRIASGLVAGNRIDGGSVGIDARTCGSSLLAGNQISNTGTGILTGATQNVVVASNYLSQNGWGVVATAFEPTLSLALTGPLTLDRNWIGFTTAQGGGIKLLDGVQGVSVTGNDIHGWGSASASQSLWVHTDAAIVRGNRWNNTAQFTVAASIVAGQPALVLPDVADQVLIVSAPPAVSSVLTEHQVDTLGQISFIRVAQGGSGYTQAQIAIAGSGSGAAANAVCANGQVVGIAITNPGSGYGAIGATAVVTITGDGSGAAATAFVGLPVLAGRDLRIACGCPLRLTVGGSSPLQQNWTQYDVTVPEFGAVELVGVYGGWYAVQSPPVDYLAPTGGGGAVVQSVGGGDLYLRPSLGGSLHIASAAEPAGCISAVGRGSPAGVVAAPPGSDYRNLNGGAGSTFWIKCSGSDANDWLAVA
jgi:parallel beta-helix repeat protein